MRPPPISAYPSRGSWHHRELRRRLQRQGSHAFPRPCQHTPHEGRGTSGRARMRLLAHVGAPLTRTWELHRRPQRQGPRESPRPFRHTPHEDRGPVGSSTEGPNGRVRMCPPAHFGTPFTRFVAP
eukprot:2121243-Pyramimonas_sp.AAC.1